MSGNLDGFDASTVKPDAGFDPIPAGKYVCIITESEKKQTKAGDGTMLQLKLDVIEGEHKGRKVFARVTLSNPNDQAVTIGMAQLSAICHAVGIMRPKDSSDLHNKPILVTVAVKKRADTGELTNEVKAFAHVDGSTPAPAPKPAAATSGGGRKGPGAKPSW